MLTSHRLCLVTALCLAVAARPGGWSFALEPPIITGLKAQAVAGHPWNMRLPSANPGQAITLLGSHLTPETIVLFPVGGDPGVRGVPVSRVAPDGTTAEAVVPLDATTGEVRVPLGSPETVRLQIVPSVTAVHPAMIPAGEPFRLELQGMGFQGALVGATRPDVEISEVEATPQRIRLIVRATNPPLLASLFLEVATAGGRAGGAIAVIQPQPEVIKATPHTLLVGDFLELTGRGFGTVPGSTTVLFPGPNNTTIVAPPVVPSTATRLSVRVPAEAVTGGLRVTVGERTSEPVLITIRPLVLEAQAAQGTPTDPTRPSVNPGQVLVIRGGFLTPSTPIRFSTAAGPPHSVLPTSVAPDGLSLTATVPPDAVTGPLEVGSLGQEPLQIVPVVTTLTPPVVSAGEPILIELPGRGLGGAVVRAVGPGPDVEVAPAQGNTPQLLRLTVQTPNPPALASLLLEVTTPGGRTTATIEVRQPPPTIATLTPAAAVVGEVIELTGRGFGTVPGSTTVLFPGPKNTTIVGPLLSSPPASAGSGATRVRVRVPPEAVTGGLRVTVGERTSEPVLIAIQPIAIEAQAAQGTPTDPTRPSANPGQMIAVHGMGFTPKTLVNFPTMDAAGRRGLRTVELATLRSEEHRLTVVVPAEAVTGEVRVHAAAALLQIVPQVTAVDFSTFAPGAPVVATGLGLVHGETTATLGAVPVEAPEVFDRGRRLRFRIPQAAGVWLTVRTPGGATAFGRPLGPTGFTALRAQAASGAPLESLAASANPGQAIVLLGSHLTPATVVQFPISTEPGVREVPVSRVTPDGSAAEVTVPFDAVTGQVRLPLGPSDTLRLQIVPAVTAVLPPTIPAGEPVRVDLQGRGLGGAVVRAVGPGPDVEVAPAQGNTPQLLRLTVQTPNPPALASLLLEVTTPGGRTTATIEVRQPPPTIATLTPAAAVVGEVIELTGRGFGTIFGPGSTTVLFAGPGGTSISAPVLTLTQAAHPPQAGGEGLPQSPARLSVRVPAEAVTGGLRLRVGSLTASGPVFTPKRLSISATATVGAPTDPTRPSANPGQVLVIRGGPLTAATPIRFPTTEGQAPSVKGLRHSVLPTAVAPDGLSLTVTVPPDAVTGPLEVGSLGQEPLQIVPVVTTLTPPVVLAGEPTLVELQGQGLKGATVRALFSTPLPPGIVMFRGLETAPQMLRFTLFIANPPPPGPLYLHVVTAGGRASGDVEIRQPQPQIEAIITSLGAAAAVVGDVIELTGRGFGTVPGSTTVLFPGPKNTTIVGPLLSSPPASAGSGATRVRVRVPPEAVTGGLRVTVGERTSEPVLIAIQPIAIEAQAVSGTPTDPTRPSANPGQMITMRGAGFNSVSRVVFPIVNRDGSRGSRRQPPASISAEGRHLTVIVPPDAVTGDILIGEAAARLQVVPTITRADLPVFAPGARLTLQGSGFVQGGTTVITGGSTISILDVEEGNRTLYLALPSSPGPTLTVKTEGGTASFSPPMGPTAFTRIEATALVGAPAVAHLPSANVGQPVTLYGTGFGPRVGVTFATVDSRGRRGIETVLPVKIAPDGAWLTVIVPPLALTGPVRVGGLEAHWIQVVPTISRVNLPRLTPEMTLTITGSGLTTDGGITVAMGRVTRSGEEVQVAEGNRQAQCVVPPGAEPTVTVTTTGGTSNALIVGAR